MDTIKIAVVQFNPVVGDITGNCSRMMDFYREAADGGADLVVFPEMATTGYPIEDLALDGEFVRAADTAAHALRDDIRKSGLGAGAIFGCLLHHQSAVAKGAPSPYVGSNHIAVNAAIIVDPVQPVNSELGVVIKRELPNYGVFDEKRVFQRPRLDQIAPVTFRGHKLGLMICEDCWFPAVTQQLVTKGAEALIAINGSPYEIGKNHVRVQQAKQRRDETSVRFVGFPRRAALPFLYVNMVGGQDELVFDGGSFIFSGDQFTQLPFFKEMISYAELNLGYSSAFDDDALEITPSSVESIYNACVMGLRDYAGKQGFKSVVLGMSGGVDSGIVGAIAADALGPTNVQLVRLPSRFSSQGSLDDAQAAAERLGSPIRTIPIEGVVDALRGAYILGGPDGSVLQGVADENIQARARGNILMAISNQEGHLLLTTGNKSEVSVGYSTLYGDMAGGFNPIKDCYKTTVWDMCRYRNEMTQAEIDRRSYLGAQGIVVPEEIIVKPPSAELREDQKDSDSLPPYEVLDSILKMMIEDQHSNGLISVRHDAEIVQRIRTLVDRAEYKRRQAAPGVKITSKLHGRERRVPIINHYRE